MKEVITYTQKEIDSKINILKHNEDLLIRERKNLNKRIRENKKAQDYWADMDLSQLKAF